MLKLLRSFEPRVLMMAAGVVGSIWLFMVLGEAVNAGGADALDRSLLLLLRNPADPSDPIGSRAVEDAMRDVTALGGTVVLTLVSLVAFLAFLSHRKRVHAAVFLGTVAVGQIASDVLKAFFGRERPELVPHGSYVYSASFPSGHAMHSATVYLTLAMLISSLETHRSTKTLAFALAILVMAAVGFSRVYLGVHWPSDVLGGSLVGAALALAAWIVLLGVAGRPKPVID